MKDNVLPLGDPATHFWLTRSAARVMGISLSEAMADGKLSTQGYSRMVTTCRQCPFVAECQEWLATQAVPECRGYEHCPNRAQFEQLQ